VRQRTERTGEDLVERWRDHLGRSTIDGIGTFTDVSGISELFGTYVQSEAHAGAGKSTKASAMTKGEVSLSIVGKGKGVDVGIAFGKFTIERAGK
jgi:hypothetical protein